MKRRLLYDGPSQSVSGPTLILPFRDFGLNSYCLRFQVELSGAGTVTVEPSEFGSQVDSLEGRTRTTSGAGEVSVLYGPCALLTNYRVYAEAASGSINVRLRVYEVLE